MKINIANMRQVTERLFEHLQEAGIDEVELTDDYYWFIPKEEIYDFTKTPTHLTAGQLTEDVKGIERFLNKEMDPVGYDLVLLGQILRYIGERNP